MEGSGEEDDNRSKPIKAKSCKGILYYSSILKSEGRDPNCFGLTGTLHLQQVPRSLVGASDEEASKEDRTLTDFRYICVGHSVYLNDDKDSSYDGKKHGAEAPLYTGIRILVDKTPSAEHASAHAHTKEDDGGFPQPQPPKPAQPIGDDCNTKFIRNASLVASGVGRNMCKVGNYIKDSAVNMVYPYSKRPK